jgi:hypothetical protein
VSQRKECVSEICFDFRGEHVGRAHKDSLRIRRILKITEYSGGKTMQSKHN